MSIDYRKLPKATIRGVIMDSDTIPGINDIPMGVDDPGREVSLGELLTDDEMAAYCEVLKEIKVELEAAALRHDYSTNLPDEIDAFILALGGDNVPAPEPMPSTEAH